MTNNLIILLVIGWFCVVHFCNTENYYLFQATKSYKGYLYCNVHNSICVNRESNVGFFFKQETYCPSISELNKPLIINIIYFIIAVWRLHWNWFYNLWPFFIDNSITMFEERAIVKEGLCTDFLFWETAFVKERLCSDIFWKLYIFFLENWILIFLF